MFDLLPFKRRSEMSNVLTEMDDMVRKMWFGFPFHNLEEGANLTWSPRLDVSETEKALEIVADLPGMDKKDISISVDGDLLTIKGEKKEVKEKKDKHYHTVERRSGSFYRALRLPVEVESDKIEAVFTAGVLTLTLPKSKESAKKITQVEIK